MSWLTLQTVAQISVERILNALPEGFLIALFLWALLRVLRKQNSGTRFAVCFLALLAIAALPLLGGLGEVRLLQQAAAKTASILHPASLHPASWTLAARSMRPALTIPGSWALFAF